MVVGRTPRSRLRGELGRVATAALDHRGDGELRRLAEVGRLIREDHLVMAGQGQRDRIGTGATWVDWDGEPFVDPTSGRPGAFMEEVLSLNEAQLVELCNYWEWRSERAVRDIDQWWCWTVVRFARQVLGVRRGYHPRPRQAS